MDRWVTVTSGSKGANTSAVDDRGRVPKRLASRKEISKLLAAKETESKVSVCRSSPLVWTESQSPTWALVLKVLTVLSGARRAYRGMKMKTRSWLFNPS